MLKYAIDLHTHCTASDGTLAPEALVAAADAHGVGVLALTDHDTLAGVASARRAAEALGVCVLPGIELSTYHEGLGLHILGIGVRTDDPGLNALTARLGGAREARLGRILARLRSVGVELSVGEVARECAAMAHVGRAHIARALVRKGAAESFQAAFDQYLGLHGPAFEEIEVVGPEEAIRTIAGAGGISSLAHPSTTRQSDEGFAELLGQLVEMGLQGLEVDTPAHPRTRKRFFRQAAAARGLLETGGSDFHEPDCGRTLGSGTARARLKPDKFRPVLERLFGAPAADVVENGSSFDRLISANMH